MNLDDIALLIKTRPDGISEEILTLLEELGAVGVFLGVENASDSGLKSLARAATMDDVNYCLLYTSDAADDLLSVDIGGRRIIKKKKQTATPTYGTAAPVIHS